MAGKQGIFRRIGGITRYIEVSSVKKALQNYDISKTHPTVCPGCGRDVFYYENSNGSQVFFDALGSPWPKHDCVRSRRKDQALKRKLARAERKRNKLKALTEKKVAPKASAVTLSEKKPAPVTPVADKKPKIVYKELAKYPGFKLNGLERVFLCRENSGPTLYSIFFRKGLAIDHLKRNGCAILNGFYIAISGPDIERLECGFCDMPVYAGKNQVGQYILKTHLY